MTGRIPTQKFKNWPKNWVLKLISLFFAIFLWYFVVGEDKVDTNVFIPLEVINLPRDLVISNQFKKQLEVTVSGPRGLINKLARQHITRRVNLSKATPGTVAVRNDLDSIPLPRGLSVLRIQPTNITLLLDRLIEKSLPIQAEIKGPPPKGFELVAVVMDPGTITLSGPQAVLGDEKLLTTEPIDITDLKGSTTKQITLNLNPAIANLIGETVVTARIIVKEKTTEKTISGIPVGLNVSLPKGVTYRIKPKTVKVRANLPGSIIKNTLDLKTLFSAKISAENLPQGKHTLAVKISSPNHIEVVEALPETVTIEIRQTKTSDKKK